MKTLFFYMTMIMVVSLNGMEFNQITPANPNCDTNAFSTNVLLLGLNQKVDAMSGIIKSQAELINSMGSTMMYLINAYKDHADVVDRASAATDSLTESLEERGDLLQKSMDADIYAEITDCTDAIDICIKEVEEDQENMEKKYQSLEKTMRSLKSQVERLQKRVQKLEPSHDQEQ